MPASIFISYVQADRVTVEPLLSDLRQRGFISSLQAEDLSSSDHGSAADHAAIERASIVLVALSPDWASSEIKLAELQTAIDLRKPIVPIRLRPTQVPPVLKIKHYIDFTEQPYDQTLDRIVNLLKVIAVPPAPEAAPDREPDHQTVAAPIHKIVNRSGGATINADTVNIYGDVVGRDKRNASTIFQALTIKQLAWPAFILLLVALIGITISTIFANAESTAAAVPTASPTVAPTTTDLPSATATLAATATPLATSTPVATNIPAPVSRQAVANTAAAIFVRPESAAPQVGSVAAQTSVTLTGRSAVGNWFYIQTLTGLRGFVYGPYFDWKGDPNSLPVIAAPIGPTLPPVSTLLPKAKPLSLDFYPLDPKGYCNSDGFPAYQFFMRGQGPLGPFQYYIENQFVGSSSDQLIYAYVFTQPGQTFITGRVTIDDGRTATKVILLSRPACAPIGSSLLGGP